MRIIIRQRNVNAWVKEDSEWITLKKRQIHRQKDRYTER